MVLFDSEKNLDTLTIYVKNKFAISDIYIDLIKNKLENFYKLFLRRWKKNKFSKRNFFIKHKEWLEQEFIFEIDTAVSSNSLILHSVGRPIKNFEDCFVSSKRRKTLDLIEEHGMEKIGYAYNLKTKIAKNMKSEVPLNSEEALALLVDLDLSKEQYLKLRQIAITHKRELTISII